MFADKQSYSNDKSYHGSDKRANYWYAGYPRTGGLAFPYPFLSL